MSKESMIDEIQEVLLTIPNMIDETVPIGKDSNDNKEIRRYGNFIYDDNKKNHIEIAK